MGMLDGQRACNSLLGMQETGKREVFFETFGVPRVVEVEDRSENVPQRTAREKADSSAIGEVGAPMGGDVLEVRSLYLPEPSRCSCAAGAWILQYRYCS
jgi:hypothetical protein